MGLFNRKNKKEEEIKKVNEPLVDYKGFSDEEIEKMAIGEKPYLDEQEEQAKLAGIIEEDMVRNNNRLNLLDELQENMKNVKPELNRLKEQSIENETCINETYREAYDELEEAKKDPEWDKLPIEEQVRRDKSFNLADFSMRYNKFFNKTEEIRSNFYKKIWKNYVKTLPDESYRTFLKNAAYEKYMEGTTRENFAKKDLEFQDFSLNDAIKQGDKALPETLERLAKNGYGNNYAEKAFLRFADQKIRESQEQQIKKISKMLDQNALQTADYYKMASTMLMGSMLFGLPRNVNFSPFYVRKRKS